MNNLVGFFFFTDRGFYKFQILKNFNDFDKEAPLISNHCINSDGNLNPAGKPLYFTCSSPNNTGRYIYIQKENDYLQLNEIYVIGFLQNDQDNPLTELSLTAAYSNSNESMSDINSYENFPIKAIDNNFINSPSYFSYTTCVAIKNNNYCNLTVTLQKISYIRQILIQPRVDVKIGNLFKIKDYMKIIIIL